MAEKESEGRAAKLMRKLSRKSVKVPSTTQPHEALPPANVRSATLPLSYDSRDLALHESHSEGLFSKLRRRFRIGSKGKYDLKGYGSNSPTKPRWLRRRSEEAQLQHEENSLGLDVDSRNAVGKSNSVKTQRKAKSDKEEVILIRKDKRVSVICKAENGASEVIFSNVDNPDEDLSETLSEMEEDPYATISSVKEEIAKTKNKMVPVCQKDDVVPSSSAACDASVPLGKLDKAVTDGDEYPYAKIDSNRKKQLTASQPSLQAKNFCNQTDTRVVSHIEPDYETLDDIKQKKVEFRSQGNVLSTSVETASLGRYFAGQSSGFDPDYESLEEVKHKSATFSSPCQVNSNSVKQNGLTHSNNQSQLSMPKKTAAEDSRISSRHSHSFGSGDMFPSRSSPPLGASLDRKRYSKISAAAGPQGSQSSLIPSAHQEARTSSSSSPTAQAPLAPTVDSSLSQDTAPQPQASPQEECIYDNPNIILRKQVSRSGTNVSTLLRRNNTHSEPPVIKTPAEEELVEKLSALLAPPLPLRNYQKDEVYSRSGAGSARHSWSSQGSRNIESGELTQIKNAERSPLASLNHSRENLITKSGKDSLVGQIHERHEFYARSNGADLSRKKEIGSLEKYLRKASPQTVASSKLLDINKSLNRPDKCDYSTVNKVKRKVEANTSQPEPVTVKIKVAQKKEAVRDEVYFTLPQTQSVQKLNVIHFCQDLARNVIEEAVKQCGKCKTSSPTLAFESIPCVDLKIVEDHDLLPVSETRSSPFMMDCETVECLTSSAVVEDQRNKPYKPQSVPSFVSSSEHHEYSVENLPSSTLCANKYQSSQRRESELEKIIVKNLVTSSDSEQDQNIKRETVAEVASYDLQGARPKVKPLLLESAVSTGGVENLKSGPKPWSTGVGPPRSESGKAASVRVRDSSTWDDTLSPAFSDLDFCDSVRETISEKREQNKNVKSERIQKPEKDCDGKYFAGNNSKIRETVYVDSDSKNENGLELNEHVTVPVKRNQCITKVAKPIVYANPRLLENVISSSFKEELSLDKAYLAHGIFRWGRYFPALDENRHAVEVKLKAFFNFVLEMVLSPARLKRNRPEIRRLQEDVDRLQVRIERKLKAVQDLPTYENIRLELLKTDAVDDWEPDNPRASYLDKSECHIDVGRITSRESKAGNLPARTNNFLSDGSERKISEIQTETIISSTQDMEVGDMLHSDDSFSEVDEVFCIVGSGRTVLNFPNSPSEVLDEFLKLSRSGLRCRYCDVAEESDSEDEMVATETYAKTVSTSFSPQFSNHVDYLGGGSFCRAFYGELAYNAHMRRHRPRSKLLIVPGPDHECGGCESHLSWNNWCTLDALFKKLVPHISPRLDFQYLLRTYAEFKHFILIDRKRNLEHKGCFMRKNLSHMMKCCRFEEFAFLKLIRDELRHFAHVFRMSEASRNLFQEERDVGFSLLSLLRLVLRNVHKMRKSMSKEQVKDLEDRPRDRGDYRVCFRHSAFQKWPQQEDYFVDPTVWTDQQGFHIRNFENFRFGSLSKTLRNWKSPQSYIHDPNVLVSCRTVFAQADTRALELTGIKGVEEPRPLQEQQDFLESMEQLQWKEWYWGPISYEQATLILKDKEDGSFLVRDSSDQKYLLSLSFKSLGEVHHTRIEHAKGLFSFWSQPESHGKARICEFIEKSIQNSRDGRFLYFLRPSARGTPPLPIRLLTPVSRNFRVATLKHLSRFVVRQSVRKDHLDLLPVPEKVKRYLKDKQYYVEILDDDQWAFDGDYGKSSK